METVLEQVQHGRVRARVDHREPGRTGPPTTSYEAEQNHEIEEVGDRLRGLFAWADTEDEETSESETEERVQV